VRQGVFPVKELSKILEENPGSVVFARYAENLMREEKYDEALEILKKGLQNNPLYAPGHSVLGSVYALQGREVESAEEFETALKLDPQAPGDYFRLGKTLLSSEPRKALHYLQTARRYEPGVSEVEQAYEEAMSLTVTPEEDVSVGAETVAALSALTDEQVEVSSDTEEVEIPVEMEKEEEESVGTGGYQYGEEMPEGEVSGEEARSTDVGDILAGLEEDVSLDETSVEKAEVFEEGEEPGEEPLAEAEAVAGEEPEAEEVSDEVFEAFEPEDILADIKKEGEAIEEKDESLPGEEELEAAVESVEEFMEGKLPESMESPGLDSELPDMPESDSTPAGGVDIEGLIDDSLPGYSEMVEDVSSIGPEPVSSDREEAGVVELDAEETYDITEHGYDLPGEEEPVITDEERDQLTDLEKSSAEEAVDSGTDEDAFDEHELSDEADSMKFGGELSETEKDFHRGLVSDLYGDLSYEEIDSLSGAAGKPDITDRTLETETREGIDYSDVLYGTDTFEKLEAGVSGGFATEEPAASGFNFDEEPESEEPALMDDEVVSDEVAAEVIEIDDTAGGAPDVSLQSETKPADEGIIRDILESSRDYNMLGQKEPDAQNILDEVEKSSLTELISDYVSVLEQDIESGSQAEMRPQGDYESDSFPVDEIEMRLAGDKPLDMSPEEDETDINDATVTMAEIFVSQGLISRAIAIYRKLILKDPVNDTLRARLAELEQNHLKE